LAVIVYGVKLALATFVSTSTTAVDNSIIYNNILLFCGILSLFGVVV